MDNNTVSVESIVEEAGELASLPDVYQRLEECINSPESTIEEISQIISADPALAVRILKLSNSALYSYPKKIESIYTALSVIGTQQLRELVLATVVLDMFECVSCDSLSMSDFWQHSIACGIAARVLATYRREANVERFYLMGLFHDIGRLLLFIKRPKHSLVLLEQLQSQHALLTDLEYATLGVEHAAISAGLLSKWKLSALQQEAVRFHHRPLDAPVEPTAASIVHVADWLANAMALGTSGGDAAPVLIEAAWQKLAIPESALETIVEYIDAQYADAVKLFLKGEA